MRKSFNGLCSSSVGSVVDERSLETFLKGHSVIVAQEKFTRAECDEEAPSANNDNAS